jgi:hypothetical protein
MISEVLLLDTIRKEEGIYVVLADLLEIIEAISSERNNIVHFYILVQFDYDLDSPNEFPIFGKTLVEELTESYESLMLSFLEIPSMRSRSERVPSFTYSLIFPNLDGAQILKQFQNIAPESQALRESDFSQFYKYVSDPFLAIRLHNGATGILEPYYFWPNSRRESSPSLLFSQYLPRILTSQSDILIRSSPYFFQGGNLLVGSDFAIVGRDIIQQNLIAYGKQFKNPPLEALLRDLAVTMGVKSVICPDLEFDRKTGIVLSQNRSLYHLDIFLTLAGQDSEGKELAMVGTIVDWDEKTETWNPANEHDPTQKLLDNYADLLEMHQSSQLNFHPIRIPLPRFAGLLYSYSNCLVEIFPNGRKRVYLPRLSNTDSDEQHFKLSDNLVKKVWNSWNFEVCFVRFDFRGLASESAGLHCITNILRRN